MIADVNSVIAKISPASVETDQGKCCFEWWGRVGLAWGMLRRRWRGMVLDCGEVWGEEDYGGGSEEAFIL
jgi:hypothetical protein